MSSLERSAAHRLENKRHITVSASSAELTCNEYARKCTFYGDICVVKNVPCTADVLADMRKEAACESDTEDERRRLPLTQPAHVAQLSRC